ncbi:MAG: hypothetical protein ACRDUX_16525 [Mycobacterium sp.]
MLAHGRDGDLAKALLLSYDLEISAVTAIDASVWTADTGWESNARVRQIRDSTG